jgi:hypothetical protein
MVEMDVRMLSICFYLLHDFLEVIRYLLGKKLILFAVLIRARSDSLDLIHK